MIKLLKIISENTMSHSDELESLKLIQKNPDSILNIDDPTDNELELAFGLKPELALQFQDIPESVQLEMVKQNPENIKYIYNSTAKVQYTVIAMGATIGKSADYYQFIKKPKVMSWLAAHPIIL
ncbi:MAG: hypothetical protein ABIP51_12235 [Bacteroidia bacterium]